MEVTKARKTPHWYRDIDWMHAEIDLGERGKVRLMEPAYDKVEEFSGLVNDEKIKGIFVTAHSLAIWVESSTDGSMPARGASVDKWVEWLRSGVENIWVSRLGVGIRTFRTRDQDPEVPN